jgi:hypothetical protein
MGMDRYVRKQAIMSGLTRSLKELQKEREEILSQLFMMDKIIEKHQNYLDLLEKDDDDITED